MRTMLASWRAAWRRWITSRSADWMADADARDEVRFHLEMREARLRDAGLRPEAARREAARRFGNESRVALQMRSEQPLPAATALRRVWVCGVGNDLRATVRGLRRSPSFAVAVIATLALGVSVNLALVAAVRSVIDAPTAVRQPARVRMLYERHLGLGRERDRVSSDVLLDWQARSTVFDGISGFAEDVLTFRDGDIAEERTAAWASPNFFTVLGVTLQRGRAFTSDEAASRASVAVVSDRFWRTSLDADPGVVGRVISLEGRPWTIIGVAPRHLNIPSSETDLWVPWAPRYGTRGQRAVWAAGRIQEGVTDQVVSGDLARVSSELQREYPADSVGWDAVAVPLLEIQRGASSAALRVIGLAGVAVLAMAIVNVAFLLMTRLPSRAEQWRTCAALGASPARLYRAAIIDTAVPSLCAGVLGWALVSATRTTLLASGLVPEVMAARLRISVGDGITGLLMCLCIGVVYGVVAARTLRRQVSQGPSRTRTSLHGGRSRLPRVSVTVQVAAAAAVTALALVSARNLVSAAHTPLGFDPQGRTLVRVGLDRSFYPDAPAITTAVTRLIEAVGAVPGVAGVAVSTAAPISTPLINFDRPMRVPGVVPNEAPPEAYVRIITPGYFATLGTRIVGREITAGDSADATPVIVINQRVATEMFGAADPLGRSLQVDFSGGWRDYVVVGVAADHRALGPLEPPLHEVFFPQAQMPFYRELDIVVSVTRPIPPTEWRTAVDMVDRALPLQRVVAFEQLVADVLTSQRVVTRALVVLASLAVILAGLGVYGVVAGRVQQQRQALGLRLALGASRRDVLRFVAIDAGQPVAAGLVMAAALVLMAQSWTRPFVRLTGLADPWALGAAAVVIGLMLAVALARPTRDVLRLEPARLLRGTE